MNIMRIDSQSSSLVLAKRSETLVAIDGSSYAVPLEEITPC